MRNLRVLSRERREHELGYKLVALAHTSSLSLRDMAIATERSESEITATIQSFYAHELMCKRNAVAERLRRMRPQFA